MVSLGEGEAAVTEVVSRLEQVSPDLLITQPAASQPFGADQVMASSASLWRRALSWVFDLGIIAATVGGLLYAALAVIGDKPVPGHLHGIDQVLFRLDPIAIPALVLTVLLAVLYTTMGAVLLQGRTLGRFLLGIRLVDSTGQAPRGVRALVRAILAIISFAFFLAGFWLALFDRRGQTLHDKLTRTFVIRPV